MKNKLSILKKAVKQQATKKKILKRKPVTEKPIIDDEEIDSDIVSDTPEEQERAQTQQKKSQRNNNFDVESEEDQDTLDGKRMKLAKKILQDTHQKVSQKDDFFLGDEDQQVHEALEQQILGRKNKVFSENAQKVKPEEQTSWYKGHTQCITSVNFDPLMRYLFSTSKDRSIIKWDIETKKKTFISLGKDEESHKHDILCAALNYDGKILATSGTDTTVKLWDTVSEKLICTLRSHRQPVQAICFGINSNNLCTVSNDRTLKLWDAGERAFIDTFFGHRADINDIDAQDAENFVSCGFDRQAIMWKTKYGSQLIFNGHDYSIDCIRSLTSDNFVTGSQDSSVALWAANKKRPIYQIPNAHGEGKWITALGGLHNHDLLASGSYDDNINLYKYNPKMRLIEVIHKLPSRGIVNRLTFSPTQQYLASVESDEHRLGRWITKKAKNQIIVYKLW